MPEDILATLKKDYEEATKQLNQLYGVVNYLSQRIADIEKNGKEVKKEEEKPVV